MKKTALLYMVIAVTLLLSAGCGGNGDGDAEDTVRTYSDPGQAISVSVNQEFIIALESNPTTGYTWEESSDGSMLDLVSQDYEQDENEQEMVGVGGMEYFRYRALKQGNTEISLVYGQHWDGGDKQPPLHFKVEIK